MQSDGRSFRGKQLKGEEKGVQNILLHFRRHRKEISDASVFGQRYRMFAKKSLKIFPVLHFVSREGKARSTMKQSKEYPFGINRSNIVIYRNGNWD